MLGERLKELRKEKKVKQKELAAILGIQESAISLYETNRNTPNDKTKVEIAKYFDVSLDYLLGVIDERVPYYDNVKFVILPENMSEEERMLLSDFFDYIAFRRNININNH